MDFCGAGLECWDLADFWSLLVFLGVKGALSIWFFVPRHQFEVEIPLGCGDITEVIKYFCEF